MSDLQILAMAGFMGRFCLGLVFVTAGLGKLKHGRLFEGVVANYRILPRKAVPAVAAALPWIELIFGAALLLQVPGPWALAAMALLLAFALAMGINLKRGRAHIDCGCNREALRQTLKWSLVVRNLVLTLLLVPALAPPFVGLDLPLAAAGLFAGAVAYLFYLLFNALAALPGLDRSVA